MIKLKILIVIMHVQKGVPSFWQWNRILFGNRASPDISQKVITSHALKLRDSYPEACDALIADTYMDDTIVSRPNEGECVELVEDLPKVTEHAVGTASMKIVGTLPYVTLTFLMKPRRMAL